MALTLGIQLRAARVLARLDQEQLAAEAGVGVVTIRTLESSRGPIRARTSTVRALQQALERRGVVLIGENGGGPGVRLREPEAA